MLSPDGLVTCGVCALKELRAVGHVTPNDPAMSTSNLLGTNAKGVARNNSNQKMNVMGANTVQLRMFY